MVGIIKNNLFVFILLLALSLVVFGNGLNNRMFYDDEELVYKNVYVQNVSEWGNFFTKNMIAGAAKISNMYRPVLLVTFGIDYLFWKNNPFGFHLTNIIIHALNAFLLFLLIKKIFNNSLVAFITAIFFIVHPIQTEAITYVSGRTDPLFSFFTLASLLSFVIYLSNKTDLKFYIYTICGFVLALLSKETAVIFPLLLFLTAIVREKNITRNFFTKMFIVLLPLFMIDLIYLFLRFTVLNFSDTFNFYEGQNIYSANLLIRIYTFSQSFWEYLHLLFWPQDLANFRNVSYTTVWYAPEFITFLVLFIVMAVLFIKRFSKYRVFFFSFFWFFICLLPSSGIIPINNIIAEHYLYLPSIGFFLAISYLFSRIYLQTKNTNLKKILIVGLLVVYTALGIRTMVRNADWKNPITFYSKTLKNTPNHVPMLNNLAMAYAEEGKLDQAETEYKKAILVSDSYAQTHHNLGNIYLAEGKNDPAEKEYLNALKIDPKFIFSLEALRKLYEKQGLSKEEIEKKIWNATFFK